MNKCILNPSKICNDCGACDNLCMLDPSKPCTNCFKCLEVEGEYANIPISDILMETDEDAFYESKEASVFNILQGEEMLDFHAVCPKKLHGKRKI